MLKVETRNDVVSIIKRFMLTSITHWVQRDAQHQRAKAMLRNHRRERFAQFVAEGRTYTAAYELAGYKPNPANAAFLAKAPEVNSRITEINSERARMQQESTAAAVKSLAITKETLIAKAEEVRLQAMENRQLSAAIAAIKEIGVLSGLRIERNERGSPGEFAEVSTEQLVSELRELGLH